MTKKKVEFSPTSSRQRSERRMLIDAFFLYFFQNILYPQFKMRLMDNKKRENNERFLEMSFYVVYTMHLPQYRKYVENIELKYF